MRIVSKSGSDGQSVLRVSLVCCLLLASATALAVEAVTAKLGKDTAWTGESVPLLITLYSPGPFAGTASFDFPDLSRTVFVRGGNPVVGSETIDDETYFTQQHVVTLYTQLSGEVVIPAFRVRFSGKKTFTSAPERIEDFTTELRFQSKRPPGTEELGVVVATTQMEVTQTWSPDSVRTVTAGDVIQRTITRRATGTTAMMMPPVSKNAPEGVRVYDADPIVQDRSERGDSTAERHDTIKYQFERAGTFTIPDTTFVWWDSEAKELRQETLGGETFSVEGDVAESAILEEPESRWASTALYFIVGGGGCLCFALVWVFITRIRLRRDDPEARTAGQLLSACRSGQPDLAYAALLAWKRVAIASGDGPRLEHLLRNGGVEFQHEAASLTIRVFGRVITDTSWSGSTLAQAFLRTRHELRRASRFHRASSPLPALNPTAAHLTRRKP